MKKKNKKIPTSRVGLTLESNGQKRNVVYPDLCKTLPSVVTYAGKKKNHQVLYSARQGDAADGQSIAYRAMFVVRARPESSPAD